MTKEYPYLADKEFLLKVDNLQMREHYLKIYILDWKTEKPIDVLEGLVTSGTVNINGNSAIRRTCNLTMVIAADTTEAQEKVKQLLGYNKKVYIEIGLLNTTGLYKDYEILWFPLETYVLTGASFTHNLQGLSISLQLKDKMCLLNGSICGTLPACVDFSQYDTLDKDGTNKTIKVPIIEIIRELLSHFGGETEERIVINGIPLIAKQVVKYDNPYDTSSSNTFHIQMIKSDDESIKFPTGFVYESGQPHILNTELSAYQAAGILPTDNTELRKHIYTYKYNSDDYIGYVYTDFVYPSELTTNYGNSVCDVLDKIKSCLSNFEQFYKNDTFYFQEKQNYLNQRDISSVADSTYVPSSGEYAGENVNNIGGQDITTLSSYLLKLNPKSQYVFDNSNIVVSYSNTPKYEDVKNDFVVWGCRNNGSNKTALRYHLAIDKIPKSGNYYLVAKGFADSNLDIDFLSYEQTYINPIHFTVTTESLSTSTDENLLKELLPQPGVVGETYALVRNTDPSVDRRTAIENVLKIINDGDLFVDGSKILTENGVPVDNHNDIIRLYYWDPSSAETNKFVEYNDSSIARLKIVKTKDWRDEIYLQGLYSDVDGTTPSYYYTEIKAEWSNIYDSWKGDYLPSFTNNPGTCNWYLDIIDTENLKDINVQAIGRRSKVVQDNTVNCVFEQNIPEFVYINCGDLDYVRHNEYPYLNLCGETIEGYNLDFDRLAFTEDYIRKFYTKELRLDASGNPVSSKHPTDIYYPYPLEDGEKILSQKDKAIAENLTPIGLHENVFKYISIANGQNSALYAVRELLTEYTSAPSTITIECLPIYYLEPNTRITVKDKASQIDGDYIIDTISCPLAANGNMTITATKINDKL